MLWWCQQMLDLHRRWVWLMLTVTWEHIKFRYISGNCVQQWMFLAFPHFLWTMIADTVLFFVPNKDLCGWNDVTLQFFCTCVTHTCSLSLLIPPKLFCLICAMCTTALIASYGGPFAEYIINTKIVQTMIIKRNNPKFIVTHFTIVYNVGDMRCLIPQMTKQSLMMLYIYWGVSQK